MKVQFSFSIIIGIVLVLGFKSQISWSDDEFFYGDSRFHSALASIEKTPMGKKLISKAASLWPSHKLVQHFHWSQVSRTDTVLTRHFEPTTGIETKDHETTIYLKRQQTQEDLVLDLAHELVHATSRRPLDPYDPGLTAGAYIWNAIEGVGGEIEALGRECEVAFQLFELKSWSDRSFQLQPPKILKRCQKYLAWTVFKGKKTVQIDLAKIKKDFYQVGSWSQILADKLKNEVTRFPLLSAQEPSLISSTGQAPYPYALYLEFQEVTQITCENARKRLSQVHTILGFFGNPKGIVERDQLFINRRCKNSQAT